MRWERSQPSAARSAAGRLCRCAAWRTGGRGASATRTCTRACAAWTPREAGGGGTSGPGGWGWGPGGRLSLRTRLRWLPQTRRSAWKRLRTFARAWRPRIARCWCACAHRMALGAPHTQTQDCCMSLPLYHAGVLKTMLCCTLRGTDTWPPFSAAQGLKATSASTWGRRQALN